MPGRVLAVHAARIHLIPACQTLSPSLRFSRALCKKPLPRPRGLFIMANKMLIDASHPEETRVVVVRGNRIEEFDFESEHKKQIRGNIYLARVTRVEPSLQAAFVEYGGNRHGFLAFSEIHPDYYQIPFADRQALIEAEAREHAEEDDDDEKPAPRRAERSARDDRDGRDGKRRRGRRDRNTETAAGGAAAEENSEESAVSETDAVVETDVNAAEAGIEDISDESDPSSIAMAVDADVVSEEMSEEAGSKPASESRVGKNDDDHHADEGGSNTEQIDEPEIIESVGSGAEDSMEEMRQGRRTARRQYKIQEVIKRRQVLLVQVVKEERGNKGAALTTYLSLAGRYSVLMPNTGRGGGISRKITSIQDRKRLKDVVKDLDVPQGMGVILRTAGANRTKAEIKRDYEYLMRMWETVRNLTLQSQAPTLVYEEGSLIKRSIRDLYNKDISEIQVSGENGYREAKDFMRMLMPSHAKMVQPYRDPTPIFAKAGIESQLDRMLQPQVTLKSGGYIIINQTEALVAVDVNSGRSTREHSIEDTALQTNLEASEEVARQLRLRDLAGLIVIDFIDMEENRNNRAVEKRLKDCLKNDRARIQVGRISHFGLMEMSRQRIRASVLESTTQVCPACGGAGHVRSPSSVGLHIIRSIEEFLLRETGFDIVVRTPAASALYVLNHKRSSLADLEYRFGVDISVEADESVGSAHLVVDKGAPSTRVPMGLKPSALPDFDESDPDLPLEDEVDEEVIAEDSEADGGEEESAASSESRDNGEKRGKRRRRRRGRGRENEGAPARAEGDTASEAGESSDESGEEPNGASAEASGRNDGDRKKRRRGRRGGRRGKNEDGTESAEAGAGESADAVTSGPAAEAAPEQAAESAEEAPKPKRSRARKPKAEPEAAQAEAIAAEPAPAAEPEAAEPVKKARARRTAVKAEAQEAVAASEPAAAPPEPVLSSSSLEPEAGEGKPRKGGWWQRKGFF
jgi:ribonuclease E